MIDAQGRVDAWTGPKDIQAAGNIVGNNFSVQANLMLNNQVWPAMAKAFQETKGDLAERMLAALDAAQAVGGDIRGRQSAAIIVVTGKPTGRPWDDRIFDLRVDDNSEPLKELRRLVRLQRAYNHMNAGDADMTRGDKEAAPRLQCSRATGARQSGQHRDDLLARCRLGQHGPRGGSAPAVP